MTRVRDAWADGTPHFSAPFVARPVATTLLTLGLALAGVLAYFQLPVAPLPQVEFPTISVQANLPGPARRPWPPPWPRRWSGRWARLPG